MEYDSCALKWGVKNNAVETIKKSLSALDRAYNHKQATLPAELLAKPLEMAIDCGNLPVVGLFFLQHGAYFNSLKMAGDGRKFANTSLLEHLLKTGFAAFTEIPQETHWWHEAVQNVECRQEFPLLLDHPQGQTIFREKYPVLLERVTGLGEKSAVKFLLKQGKEWRTPTDVFPALLSAVNHGHYDLFLKLFSYVAPIKGPSEFALSSLEYTLFSDQILLPSLRSAVKQGRFKFVKRLLEHGADPNKVPLESNGLKRPRTALQLAIYRKEIDIAELLCEYGADVVCTTSYDRSYTMRVVWQRNLKLAEKHLSQMTREHIQEGGYLQVATGMGNLPMVKLLLDYGASATTKLRLSHRKIQSPMNGIPMSEYAEYKGHAEIARMLREYAN